MDSGGTVGDTLQRDSLENEFIFDENTFAHTHVIVQLNLSCHFLTEEVTDLHGFAGVFDGDIDGEMCINEPHLIAISKLHAHHHVVDMAGDGTNFRHLFSGAKPLSNCHTFSLLLCREKYLDLAMMEIAFHASQRSRNLNVSTVNLHTHCRHKTKPNTNKKNVEIQGKCVNDKPRISEREH